MRKKFVITAVSILVIVILAYTQGPHIHAILDLGPPNQAFTVGQSVPAYTVVHTSGSPYSLVGYSGYYWNNTSGSYGWQLDAPIVGKQYCFGNYPGRSGILTVTTAPSVYIAYEGINGTITTGTLISGGALGDFVCMEAVDLTHYVVTGAGYGSWTPS
jgi:hypothetical protein